MAVLRGGVDESRLRELLERVARGEVTPALAAGELRIAASAEAEALAPRLGHEDWYALLGAARGHPVP